MRSPSLQWMLLSIFVCVFLLSTAQKATACSCGAKPTVLDAFDESDEVVIVKVISVEKAIDTEVQHYVDGVRSATLIVEKVFKGKLKIRDEIVFGQGGGADCIWTFSDESIGDQYLFYLTRPENVSDRDFLPSKDARLWFAFGCGRSTGLGDAADDLLYLENIAKRRGKTRISGTIGGWRNPDLDVAGKRIKIIGSKKTYEVRTDKNGVFEIYDVPPGKYLIEPEMPAGWKIDASSLRYSPSVHTDDYPELKSPKQVGIKLEAKKHAAVDISFEMDNSVQGRVLDSSGKPMYGVCVRLLSPEQDQWGPTDCTDEQGRFKISSVAGGEYVLVANHDGKLSSREPFRKIFYPNAVERDRAAVISIGAGDTIDNIDIVISKLEETVTIEGVLRYSDGKPAAEEWVKFKVAKTDDNVDGDASERTDTAGRFTLRVLKGLTGELAAEHWIMTGLYQNCPKVDELIAKSGEKSVTVQSNVIKLTTEQNVYELELTFPFPRCEKAKE